jgi:hypothetical protein
VILVDTNAWIKPLQKRDFRLVAFLLQQRVKSGAIAATARADGWAIAIPQRTSRHATMPAHVARRRRLSREVPPRVII